MLLVYVTWQTQGYSLNAHIYIISMDVHALRTKRQTEQYSMLRITDSILPSIYPTRLTLGKKYFAQSDRPPAVSTDAILERTRVFEW